VNSNLSIIILTKLFFLNSVDMCAGGLSFWIFGFGLMYGRGELTNGLFGAGDFFLNAKVTDPLMGQIFTLYFFQMSFATTSTTIVSAAIAERCRITSYMLFSFLATFVYAVGGGWIWGSHGWLKNIGVVDFAGSGPIHVIAGASCEYEAEFHSKFVSNFHSISLRCCLVHRTPPQPLRSWHKTIANERSDDCLYRSLHLMVGLDWIQRWKFLRRDWWKVGIRSSCWCWYNSSFDECRHDQHDVFASQKQRKNGRP
jgi:hypothetical protein